MLLSLDDLNTFKKHKNNISELLNTKLVGRDKDVKDIYEILNKYDYLVLTGPAGVGKTRLAIAVMEKYISKKPETKILCTKSFTDYIVLLEQEINYNKEYIIFIDDVNNYKEFDKLFEFLKYKNNGNIKVLCTIRNYLNEIINNKIEIVTKEIKPIENLFIKEAIRENMLITNNEWLNQIVNISKGNIRIAYIAADVTCKANSISSIYNTLDIVNKFYKVEMSKIDKDDNLILTACIIAFFKSIYLDKIFYISPILNILNISKEVFLNNINILISMEIVDEYMNVVRINDQCFSDYLLYYFLIEKKYIKINELISKYYKYYKNRIIEIICVLLSFSLDKELLDYVKNEVIYVCENIDNIELKHDIELDFAVLILDYIVNDFKDGVNNYKNDKSMDYLLKIFVNLAKSKYNNIAVEGICKLLDKSQDKEIIYKAIQEAYKLDYESIKNKFVYLIKFVTYIDSRSILNDCFYNLITSYLNFTFDETKMINNNEINFISYEINDGINDVILLRTLSFKYLFKYDFEKGLKLIINYSKNIAIKDNINIVSNDLKLINDYLSDKTYKEIIQAILYVRLHDNSIKCKIDNLLCANSKYEKIISIIFNKMAKDETYREFEIKQKDSIKQYYLSNKISIYKDLNKCAVIINQINSGKFVMFLNILLNVIEEYDNKIFNVFIKYNISPYNVVYKMINLLDFDRTYIVLKNMENDSVKDEYLYNFYSIVSEKNLEQPYEFDSWLKLKYDRYTNASYKRSVGNLINIAKKCNISYLDLIKAFYKKKDYNKFIAKMYLNYIFYRVDAFKELANLDIKLAIKIYEFLIECEENDYDYKNLNEILSINKNYIKVYSKMFIKNKNNDIESLGVVIFKNEYTLFLNECIKIILENKIYDIYQFQMFVSKNINKIELRDWIFDFIEKEHKNVDLMKILFKSMAYTPINVLAMYILKYFDYENKIEILSCALLSKLDIVSVANIEKYYENKINDLEYLKDNLISWDNVENIKFINNLIENYKIAIKKSKIEGLIDFVAPKIYDELEELDGKSNISLKEAFDLYINDEEFRNMILSDYVSYNNKTFITKNNKTIKFTELLENKKILGIRMIENSEDVNNYKHYLSEMKSINNIFFKNKSASLSEYFTFLFKEKNWTVSDFEMETSLPRDVFSKIKNNKKNKFEKRTIIKILIGLKIPKSERNFLLELNGTTLSIYNRDDVIYNFILSNKIDINTAEDLVNDLKIDIL